MVELFATEYTKDFQLQLHSFATVFYFCTFSGKHFILSYLINVRKTFQIKLFSLYSELIAIFDGPGFIFPIIKTNNQYYTTSSFQSVVQFYKRSPNTKLDRFLTFSAFDKEPSNYLNIKQEHAVFFSPTLRCTNILCVTEVKVQNEHQVNFTVSNISTLKTGCLFWGLVTIDPGDKNHESQKTMPKYNKSPK